MAFNSFAFAVFMALVYPAFLSVRRWVTGRNAFIVAASYVFYGWWDWRFLGLIAASTAIDYAVGLGFGGQRAGEPRKGARERALLLASCVANLGLLCTFKYFDFFVGSLEGSLAELGIDATGWRLGLVLPAGISFYTFQTMSYTIDLYRGRIETERDALAFAAYVSFFPQLVAGPIERAAHLLPQFKRVMPITGGGLRLGCSLIVMGLFKKVVLADNAAGVVESVFGAERTAGWEAWVGAYAFAVQIYCDFSGYSDVARGLGKVMGFDLMVNFAMPYASRNPREFWQRWHVSLSSWLRDYLYVPLGGNRHGRWRTYAALMATMVLGGLWHGAAWTFVAWGVLHGSVLVAHRALGGVLGAVGAVAERRGAASRWAWGAARVAAFFHLTCVGWVLFRAETLGDAWAMMLRMAGAAWGGQAERPRPVLSGDDLVIFCATAGCVALGHAVGMARGPHWVQGWSAWARGVWYGGLVLAIVVLGVRGGEPFIYFAF